MYCGQVAGLQRRTGRRGGRGLDGEGGVLHELISWSVMMVGLGQVTGGFKLCGIHGALCHVELG